MNFFQKIKSSIYSPSYYSEVRQKPFSYSLKYYLLFSLLFAFLATIVFSFSAIPGLKSILATISDEVLDYYPQDLEITIKAGRASTNVQEPYFIEAPANWRKGFKNLLVLNTGSDFSVEDFKNFETACLLTKTEIVCYDDNQSIKVTPLSELPDGTLNKAVLSGILEKITPILKVLYPLFFIGALVVFFLIYIFKLVVLFIYAFFVWLVAKIKQNRMGYWKAYQLGIHLMTLPIILAFLFNYFIRRYLSVEIPFAFLILVIIMAAINLRAQLPAVTTPVSNIPANSPGPIN